MQNYQLSEIHVHFVLEFSNCDSLLHLKLNPGKNCSLHSTFNVCTHRAPADMIHTSAKTQMALKKDYDEFGDSYMQDTTPDQLKYTFQHMDNVGFNSSIGY